MKFFKKILSDRTTVNLFLGISWFWFVCGGLSTLFISNGNLLSGAFLLFGFLVGYVMYHVLSFDRVEIGLVPLATIGLGLSLAVKLFKPAYTFPSYLILALFSALYVLPLYDYLKLKFEHKNQNILLQKLLLANWASAAAGLAAVIYLKSKNFEERWIFLGLSISNLIVSFIIFTIIPEFTLRFVLWLVSRLMYRIRVEGAEKIPTKGGAIIISNHVSFIDWMFIVGVCKRPVRIVMWYKYFDIPGLNYLCQKGKVIPIASKKEDPEVLNSALETISHELSDGQVLCFFPEGGITRTGELEPFKMGIEKILEQNPVPVIPVALIGLWGSMFSRSGSKIKSRLKRKFWYRVTVRVGDPMPAAVATASNLESAMRCLF